MDGEPSRIRFLDGLRGLAIVLVMGFHYFGHSYAAQLPYGDQLAWIPIFNHGWVGVFLFFLISGYVIFMTLEKCSTAGDFLKRRWLRLFPAMIIVSAAIFASSQVMGSFMPLGKATLLDLLPGLMFISDPFWHAALHNNVHSLDGVFWTLYVEVGFYIVIGTLYFLLGWQRALLALLAIWLMFFAASSIIGHLPKSPLSRIIEPFQWLGVTYYGWFAAGALFFKAAELKSNKLFGTAVAIAILACFTYSNLWSPIIGDYPYLLGCIFIFASIQRWQGLQIIFQSRFALFMGMISYPLYLLHCEIGVGLLGVLGRHTPTNALPLLPFGMAAFMCLLAWIVAKYVEPATRDILTRAIPALSKPKSRPIVPPPLDETKAVDAKISGR